MSDHLPECGAPDHALSQKWEQTYCICKRLRACEARVTDDLTRQSDDYTTGYAMGQADMRKYLLADDTHSYTYGYRAALDAARDAVAALHADHVEWKKRALAAIDALREGK